MQNGGNMDDISRRIGLKISFLRRQYDMTQEQLSEHTQLSQNFLSQLETGRKTPSILTLHKISGAIKVPLSELFEGGEIEKNTCSTAYKLDKKILSAISRLSTPEKKKLYDVIKKLSVSKKTS